MRTFRGVVRGLAVVAVVMALSLPAEAARVRERAPREKENPIVKVIKLVVRSFGDGLVEPRP
jgi:uncharacterized membrane protein